MAAFLAEQFNHKPSKTVGQTILNQNKCTGEKAKANNPPLMSAKKKGARTVKRVGVFVIVIASNELSLADLTQKINVVPKDLILLHLMNKNKPNPVIARRRLAATRQPS